MLAAVVAPVALADGDPASDVLFTSDVFVPYAKPQPALVESLQRAIDTANTKGYRIKVAVIGSKNDLGIVTSLDRKPQRYAEFLGSEIRFFYHGHLLVVMPNGFGVFADRQPVTVPVRLVRSLKVGGSDSNSLVRAATAAVKLLTARDKSLPRYRDVYPPAATAFPATAKAGQTAQLPFVVYDDSLRGSAVVEVYGPDKALVATIRPPSNVANGRPESVEWEVPAALAGKAARFCVRATDGAGNKSKESCASVTIT